VGQDRLPRSTQPGIMTWRIDAQARRKKKEPSFSEEKEAKRL
jgi:hypothetical protein